LPEGRTFLEGAEALYKVFLEIFKFPKKTRWTPKMYTWFLGLGWGLANHMLQT